MCGRFYIAGEDAGEELRAIIEEAQRRSGTAEVKTGEIFPTDTVPVIANNRNMAPTPFAMGWGYTQDKKRLINARSETAADKPTFRDGMLRRRCLIPASHYFEWEKRGKEKIKYAIQPTGSYMLYIAGIYRMENDKPVFTILTRNPAPEIAFIHNRMPVILPKDALADWLNPEVGADQVLAKAMLDMQYHTAA